MSDIPAWLDDGPPPDMHNGPPARRDGSRSGYQRRQEPEFDVGVAAQDFYAWLDDRATRAAFKTMLPDTIDLDVFIATAKTAVLNNSKLLAPNLRESLLIAVQRAAAQGLPPDGKHGALVPRYDTEARQYRVAWQPMVWGIVKLGRQTGAIKSIRAVIVFAGERFEIEAGDEDRYSHRVDRAIVEEAYAALNGGRDQHGNVIVRPDEFMRRIDCAYCIITGTDGTVTKRWMTRSRIMMVRNSSKAAKGPWASAFIDEMVAKTVILFTTKHVDLDVNNPATQRFRLALETDMAADFDAITAAPDVPSLPAPGTRLDMFEEMLGRAAQREPVHTARQEPPQSPPDRHAQRPPDDVPADTDTPHARAQERPQPAPASTLPSVDPEVAAGLRAQVDAAIAGFATATAEQVRRTTDSDRYKYLVRQLIAGKMIQDIERLTHAASARNEP